MKIKQNKPNRMSGLNERIILNEFRKFSLLSLLSLFSLLNISAQKIYQTEISSKLIKTLQVKQEGHIISDPIIELNGEDLIEINFDAMDHNYNRFAYSIIHCDADWKQSSLSPIEYMDGFQGLTIEDFANSITTTTQYTNYRLLLPNDDIQLKVSGNYVVQVYKEGQPDIILLTACFSIVEPLVSISTTVSGNTMIDVNREHQQVSFSINHRNLPITYPQTDLKIFVLQNNRKDNLITNLKPTTILDGQLVYDHNRDLIFEAGNEYRRIEFLSNKYNGMGVQDIQYHNPYYHIQLIPDHVRNNVSYQYDQDQNGHFFIRCSNCNDPDTEADYYIVHFALLSDPLPDGIMYLNGDIYNNVLGEDSKMGYNFDTGCYEKSVLLKQGIYNYQYLFVPNTETKGQTGIIEGNFYQTENQYTILVYFRPMGSRYDRLIGISTIKNAMNIL